MANSVKLMTAALRNGMNVEAIWGCPSTASFKIGTILSPQGYDYKFEGHVSQGKRILTILDKMNFI